MCNESFQKEVERKLKTLEKRCSKLERQVSMLNDKRNGKTLKEIGSKWKVTPSRVHQILKDDRLH